MVFFFKHILIVVTFSINLYQIKKQYHPSVSNCFYFVVFVIKYDVETL